MAWLVDHWPAIVAALLAVSEGLAVLFPSQSGFGGILAGIVKVLKALGAAKDKPAA